MSVFIPLGFGLVSCIGLILVFMKQQRQYIRDIEIARLQVEKSLQGLKELIEQ